MPIYGPTGGGSAAALSGSGIATVVSPIPIALFESSANMNLNVLWGVRVVVPTTGTLHDLAVFPTTQAGNIEVGVMTAASTRALLYTSTAVACPAANAWGIVGDPALSVTAGDNLDFVFRSDTASSTWQRHVFPVTQMSQLPSGFLPTPGSSPKLAWTFAAQASIPATVSEANCTITNLMAGIIARIA